MSSDLARGVWNPFSLCVLADGRIFAVDNDPDASPPCRLLHVVPGGDYGYLYQYGRAGTHPLQCWNGELPGTLPMVCGTGEAPTAIVPHAGGLWVTSWGDHRIERYELVPRGASYGAKREVIVQGDADFRPTGMAVAPDGSLYFADWVLRDYPVHGRGRIWRLALPPEELKKEFAPRSKEDLAASNDAGDPVTNAESSDPFVHTHGVWQLSQQPKLSQEALSRPRIMLSILEAERIRNSKGPEKLLRFALNDESADVRLFAVRWIADDRIRRFAMKWLSCSTARSQARNTIWPCSERSTGSITSRVIETPRLPTSCSSASCRMKSARQRFTRSRCGCYRRMTSF